MSLTYFPYVIPFSITIYTLLVSAIVAIRYWQVTSSVTASTSIPGKCCEHFFTGDQFEFCYWSCIGLPGPAILLVTRAISFAYLFGISFVAREIIDPEFPISFTSWNIHLLWIYFLSATIASMIGLHHDDCSFSILSASNQSLPPYWSQFVSRFGYILQFMFAVAGSTAFFVTFVAFTFLDHRFEFWNASFHFVTSLSVFFELVLNRIVVRWEHLVLSLSWSFLYLIFSWIIVQTGVISHWPYFFLDTSTPTVFLWYMGLMLLNSVFYCIFWSMSSMKFFLIDWIRNFFFHRFSLLKSDFETEIEDQYDSDVELVSI
jgi:hypothetical protein